MELRVLKYFLMAAREENMTRAAQLLHVTQPTLSRQIMQLEEELGVKLFERSSHNITLTNAGMMLKRRAQEMVSLADKAVQELTQSDENLAGEISIGCGELMSFCVLSRLIAAFREKYPLIRFELFSANADQIKERIEHGTLDTALLIEPVDISRYEFIRMPVREEWCALVQKGSALAEKGFATPTDLAGIPLYMPKRELVRNEISNWFGEYADKLDIVMTHNLIYNTAMMISCNGGAAVTIRLDYQFSNAVYVPLRPGIKTGSVLAWKKNQTVSPAAEAFVEFAKQYILSIE